jgi:hypothetical protein
LVSISTRPEHALVLSVDEKSQIQALDRAHPGLPMKKGRGQTMTHVYKRNGTTTFFAALNTANGEVYGLCQQKPKGPSGEPHSYQEPMWFADRCNTSRKWFTQPWELPDWYA